MADATAQETESAADRRRRRDRFLRALNEARAVRNRVRPQQARAARMRRAIHLRTFSW
ncbi:hypothetical protein [Streptomyces sp. S465]|uniref:hypothetical protein n=1 Tax=Streptomyces sp. S465 TaxID=2979468 RepID=UPI0022A89FDD|nr:hypothetical protein [Streptomyces sp. S465]WAP56998.1 hypothetical protein N6H00_19690 [Streptomyces sp. S465]